MKILKFLCALITAGLLLCSCYDSNEPNDLAYATAVGIDKGENNNFNITIQFAKPHSISGGEGGGSGEDILGSLTVEAPNIYAAIGLGNHIISKSLDLSHLQLFLFSEEVAKEGIHNFIETISRSKEIRPNVYTAVCKNKASEYLKSATPVVDINPSKYYQLIFGKSDFRSIPESYSQDLYFYMRLSGKNSVIPLAGVSEGGGEKGGGESQQGQGGSGQGSSSEGSGGQGSQGGSSSEQNPLLEKAPVNTHNYEFSIRDYEAGQVEVFSDAKGEVTGSAVFKGDKMVGSMGIVDTQIYNYLTGDTSKNYVTFKTEKSTSPITVLLGIDDKTRITYDKKNHTSNIKLSFAADFVALPDDYVAEQDLEYFQSLAEKAIKEQAEALIHRTQTEFNSDIVGFGMAAKNQFITNKEFDRFNWDMKYKDMKYSVDVELEVRRTGLTLRKDI